MLSMTKTHLYEGDLKLPRLGLSKEDAKMIFTEANCIIHNGAEVSFLQSYHSLRLPNFLSLRELVVMTAGKQIPLHFVSTTQVGVFYAEKTGLHSFSEVTVADCPPPTDGTNGYPASKWAGERFLERLKAELSFGRRWPIFIHRPSIITSGEVDMVSNIRHFSAKMAAIPYAPHLRGYLNIVPLEKVVAGIIDALYETDLEASDVHFRNHIGEKNISLSDPVEAIFGNEYKERYGALGKIVQLSPREWAKRAGELGLDKSVVKWVSSVEAMGEQFLPEIFNESGSQEKSYHSDYIPSTQIAIVEDSDGMPIIINDKPVPKLRQDTVLIKTVAVALNPSDYKMGAAAPSAGAIVGMDFAGRIVAISKAIDRADLSVGDMVCGIVHGSNPDDHESGSFAQYVLAAADFVLKVPAGMSPQQAATLGTGLLTGCMALWSSLEIPATPDDPARGNMKIPVLVYGGSTSSGTIAIQLLKL
jgi:nucleoside-diphosphate-sugar epimerase